MVNLGGGGGRSGVGAEVSLLHIPSRHIPLFLVLTERSVWRPSAPALKVFLFLFNTLSSLDVFALRVTEAKL